ncbi:MAG: helix-turn-helix transcriptional regulator [Clostridia bacterium]|nr:helix-turn-helix transcriptional regulator [Clostridia bacterium]
MPAKNRRTRLFREKLSRYLESLGVSASSLAKASGLSVSAVFRYRSGERVPSPGSGHLKSLSRGIAALAAEKGLAWDADEISGALTETLTDGVSVSCDVFCRNLRSLLSFLSVRSSTLARALSFDPSYVSRILAGSRRPADLKTFSEDTANYLAERAASARSFRAALSSFLGLSPEEGIAALREEVVKFLLGRSSAEEEGPLSGLLQELSNFDLADYTRSIRFDGVQFSTAVPRFGSFRAYSGVREMREGELDFIRLTLLSPSQEDVIAYSELSMSKDPAYVRQWMLGMELLTKKGLRLHVLYNLDRPLSNLLLGMERYVPLYMTGQILPYYLPEAPRGVFSHHFRVSGAAALEGSAPDDDVEGGEFLLSKSKPEVERCRRIGEALLSRALPLVEIYASDRRNEFRSLFRSLFQKPGNIRLVGDVLPFSAMSEGTLDRILARLAMPRAQAEEIRVFHREGVRLMESILAERRMEWVVYVREDGEALRREPPALSALSFFTDIDAVYTEEEYALHLEDTRAFAASNPRLSLVIDRAPAFRNLFYTVFDDAVLVSKGKSPSIHYVLRHPALVAAFRRYEPPLVED